MSTPIKIRRTKFYKSMKMRLYLNQAKKYKKLYLKPKVKDLGTAIVDLKNGEKQCIILSVCNSMFLELTGYPEICNRDGYLLEKYKINNSWYLICETKSRLM